MTQELEKAIALLQHKEEDFFILNDEAVYFGTIEDAKVSYADSGLAISFDEWCKDNLIEVDEYDETDHNRGYNVFTDEEADDEWDRDLESYIDECILPQLEDKTLSKYFNREAWKEDARNDGRGHSLNRYDGEEYEETVNGTMYFIYQIN